MGNPQNASNASSTLSHAIAEELEVLQRYTDTLFGYHAVQLGLCHIPCLAQSRVRTKLLLAENASDPPANICSTFTDLPFANQSIDVVVLPHTLDSHPYPQAVLREVARILTHDGHIILSGFNPHSIWGLQGVPVLEKNALKPNKLSHTRTCDWLKLLNFDIQEGCFLSYRPLIHNEKWFHRLSWMESAGDRWWSFFGNIYVLHAQKRSIPLSPIRQRKNLKELIFQPTPVPATGRKES